MSDVVFFDPHVGSKYDKDNALFTKRVMILGDSHYCKDECADRTTCGDRGKYPDCTQLTHRVVEWYLNPNCNGQDFLWKRTYTTFINSMLGKDTTPEERAAFFESVVFYNYMQAAAGASPDVAGNYDHSDGRYLAAFYEVIDKYRPEVIVSWGQRLWNTLPNDFGYGEAVKGAGLKIGDSVFRNYYDYAHVQVVDAEDAVDPGALAHHEERRPRPGHPEWHRHPSPPSSPGS